MRSVPAEYPASQQLAETDPIAQQRLDALGLTFSTDAERDAAVAALQAVDALKQDAATAATDAELAAARAAIEAVMATDAELAAATSGTGRIVVPPWRPGNYYGQPASATTGVPGEATLELMALWVPPGARIDQIAEEVTVAGSAGALRRLGIYADAGDGRPGGPPLLDAGTYDASTVGVKLIDLAAIFAFPAPGLYWVGGETQGAAATRPTIRRNNSAVWPGFGSLAVASYLSSFMGGYQNSGGQGGLPTLNNTQGAISNAPRIAVRAA
jgi:hypothetical protein